MQRTFIFGTLQVREQKLILSCYSSKDNVSPVVATPVDVHLFGHHVHIDATWTCACTSTDGCEQKNGRILICNSIFDGRLLPDADYLHARTEPHFYNITNVRFKHARCNNSMPEAGERRMSALGAKLFSLPRIVLVSLAIYVVR